MIGGYRSMEQRHRVIVVGVGFEGVYQRTYIVGKVVLSAIGQQRLHGRNVIVDHGKVNGRPARLSIIKPR